MLSDASSDSVNFVAFITMFGKRMQGTDPEEAIKNAFICLDEKNTGLVSMDFLREALTSMGNKFTDEEVGWPRNLVGIFFSCFNFRLTESLKMRQSKKIILITMSSSNCLKMVVMSSDHRVNCSI